MCKQEALHSSLQLGNVHDLCKVALHNGQLLGVTLALVLRVLPLQCSQSGTHTPDDQSSPQRTKWVQKPSLQAPTLKFYSRTQHNVVGGCIFCLCTICGDLGC